jgi:hypothetical protein
VAGFSSEQDVYDEVGGLLAAIVERAGPLAQRADTVVEYRLRHPEATIVVDLRRDSEPACVFGKSDLVAEVVMTMDADTAHRFFLGELNFAVALARGDIGASGPVRKILKLAPLVRPARKEAVLA